MPCKNGSRNNDNSKCFLRLFFLFNTLLLHAGCTVAAVSDVTRIREDREGDKLLMSALFLNLLDTIPAVAEVCSTIYKS